MGQFVSNHGGTLSSAGTLLGGITGALGAIQGGEASNSKAKYEAAVFRNNRVIAERAAKTTIDHAVELIHEKQLSTAQEIAKQQASFAARGVQANRDSAVEIAVDTARISAKDQAAIRNNAEEEALALRIKGINFETQAIAAEKAGKDAKRASILKASGTLLKTGSSVASKWLDSQKPSTGETNDFGDYVSNFTFE